MLHARIALREQGGAQPLASEWRPEDRAGRLRAVAELAFRMQHEGGEEMSRAPLVRAWSDAVHLLPAGWTQEQRDGFLVWLVNSAGVMVDRSDGSVSFAHLSFQECLAADHLFRTTEGEARLAKMRELGASTGWWETLRQWAALLADQNPDWLRPVLTGLQESERLRWLAGSILADGAGDDVDLERWAGRLDGRSVRQAEEAHRCAAAWRASRRGSRRAILARALPQGLAAAHWLDATAMRWWASSAGIELVLPDRLSWLEFPKVSPGALARSRALAGENWLMPWHGAVVLLRLWPSWRARLALSLQSWLELGGSRRGLSQLARSLWSRPELYRATATGFARRFAQDWLRYFLRCFGQYTLRGLDTKCLADLEQCYQLNLWHADRYSGADFLDCLNRGTLGAGWYYVRDLRSGSRLDAVLHRVLTVWQVHEEPHIHDFVTIELDSIGGRVGARAVLGGEVGKMAKSGSLSLFHHACHSSLHPDDPAAALTLALQQHAGDEPAEDRALLESLAREPEQREGVLSWGQQYWVRGDLVMEDGSHLTLDELADELGLPRLPLLEDQPPELELDVPP